MHYRKVGFDRTGFLRMRHRLQADTFLKAELAAEDALGVTIGGMTVVGV